ncbi:MAG: cytochrome P450 [Steroidobacteraceae bacterium]
MLKAAVDGKALTECEVLMYMLGSTFGGLHTTKAVLSRITRYFARKPDVREGMRNELQRIGAFIEDFVRMYCPPAIWRYPRQDTVIGGCPVKEGEMIALAIAAANRDPRAIDDPASVSFERGTNKHLGWGYGMHMCLGMHLARADMRIALEDWHRLIPDYGVRNDAAVTDQVYAMAGPSRLPLQRALAR